MGPGKRRSRSRSPRERDGRRDNHRRDRQDDGRRSRRYDNDDERRAAGSRHEDKRHSASETTRLQEQATGDSGRAERHGSPARPHARRDDSRPDSRSGARHTGHSGGEDRRKAPPSRSDAFGTNDTADQQPSGSRDGSKMKDKEEGTAHIEARNFERSGKLVEETNTFRGVVINYSEPDEARKPQRRWRLYPFKGDQQLEVLYIHRQSAYLIGRDRKVCDIAMHHPSISKQHAALQYRLMPYVRDNGSTGHRVCPYLIDLDSTNGCYINNQRVDPQRYYELKPQDMMKFGFSSREYVVLHEGSKDDDPGEDAEPADGKAGEPSGGKADTEA